jgi:serine/threonine-protein kinase
MEKDPRRRLHDIADARIEIEDALTTPDRIEPASAAAGRIPRGWRPALLWGLTCLVVGAITASIALWKVKPPPPPAPVSRLTIALPPGERLAGLEQPAVAVSPDGTRLAYLATQGGGAPQLYLRAMDSLESKPISGTEGAANPFFSPDGQWVGFFAGGKLKKVSMSGGAAVTLANAAFPRGASWGSQGIIVFAPSQVSHLQQVSEAGGAPQALTRLEKGEIAQGFPEFLPGGKAVLFAASITFTNWTNAQVAVYSLETGERRNLIQGGTSPRYARSGHLVYAQGGTLMAAPFDPERLVLTGAAVPVVESVRQSVSSGGAHYSLSATGSLVYVPGGIQATQRRLVWVSRGGAEQVVAAPAHEYRNPRLSPDGRQVAVAVEEQQNQVWLYDVARETLTPLTFEGSHGSPAWTPDGKRIVFYSTQAGPPNLFWQLADGSGGIGRLTTSDYIDTPSSWTPDGQVLAFTETTPTTGIDIWTLRLSDRKAQPFVRTPSNEGAPRFSPDRRWLAYVSDESGRDEICLQPYPGSGGKRQISTEGGNEPAWNGNGRELFYRNGNKMMAVEVRTQPGFSAGKPRVLFEGPYVPAPVMFPNYDVTADGQRFLMLKANEQDQAATQIHVVLNWFEELKRRVGEGRK